MKKYMPVLFVVFILALVVFFASKTVMTKAGQENQKTNKTIFTVGTIKAEKSLLKEVIEAQSIAQGDPQVKVYPNAITGLFINNTVKEGDYVIKDQDIAYIDRNIPGSDYAPALLFAGPIRLRPILMTTFAMIFGMLPLALGLNEGSSGRQALPVTVIGGLLTSTFLTLVVVPVVYERMESFFEKRKLEKQNRAN
jgi:hypothetical protein